MLKNGTANSTKCCPNFSCSYAHEISSSVTIEPPGALSTLCPWTPLGLAGIDSHPAYLLLCRPISRLLSLPAITSSLCQGHLKPNFSVYHLTTDCQHSVSGAGRFCKMALCKFSVYLVYFTGFYLAPRCYWEIWAIFAVSKVVIVEIFSI